MSQTELSFRGKKGPGKPDGGPPVITVSMLVRGANRVLELRFPSLCVEGEVVGLRVQGSGHAFFNLKDDFATLPVAMWRSSVEQLTFDLSDGQMIRIYGRLGIFAKTGKFQFYADRAEPAGLGALMAELEARKKALAAEGLFEADRKRPLPPWPRRIGVVTSAHGAAIHDILKVARRRCPSRILLAPAVVQGPDAPRAIQRGLQRLARQPDIDVIVVGRGGGSMEDLWAFNAERVARAIADSPIPVVSAVGHETDVTIADMVADVRAATPSHAAELVVPDLAHVQHRLEAMTRRVTRAMERATLDQRTRLDSARAELGTLARRVLAPPRTRLAALQRRLEAEHPRARIKRDRVRLAEATAGLRDAARELTAQERDRLLDLEHRLRAAARSLCADSRSRFATAETRLRAAGHKLPRDARMRLVRASGALHALSPLSVLGRGYAVVTDAKGRAITDAAALTVEDEVGMRLHRGKARARVTFVDPDDG